jgi:hypothetical protein
MLDDFDYVNAGIALATSTGISAEILVGVSNTRGALEARQRSRRAPE